MMMTSGAGVHYKSMFDAGSQIIAKEGTKSLFKGAGANILRGVAGAGVLSLYDKLQEVMFGKVYSGGWWFLYHLVLSEVLTDMQDLVDTLISSAQWLHGVPRPPIDLFFASSILFSHFGRHFVGARIRYLIQTRYNYPRVPPPWTRCANE